MPNPAVKPSIHVPLRTILGIYARAAWKYKWVMFLVFCAYSTATVFQDVIIQLPVRDIIDIIAKQAPDPALWPLLWQKILMMIGITVIFFVGNRVADFSNVFLESNVQRDLSNYAFAHLRHHSAGFFSGNFTGSLVAKARRFVRAFEVLFDQLVYNFLETTVQLIGVIIVLALAMPILAWIVIGWSVFYIVLSYFVMKIRLKYDFLSASEDSAVTGQLSDVLTNILNLKVFTSGEREVRHFASYTQREYKARSRAWNVGNTIYALQAIAMSVLEIGGMVVAIRLWMNGQVSPGTVVLTQAYFATIMMKLWGIGRAMSQTFKALSDAEEMVAILRKPLEVTDPPHPEVCRMTKGEITFHHIAFHYRDGKDVFTDFSLTVPPGQRVGMVGYSGAGKSTLFKLLLRFMDVTGGSITIDGQDLRAVTQDDLRRAINYVPQDPILFHRSLFENIAYAKPTATREEVEEAARRAHAHEFITALPKGYDTCVGERGIKLSGGERQRIALARVILKAAPILLLDEATSSLDSISEQFIQEQLSVLMHGRTTLAIAHRISTIRQMDRILVLHEGTIAEDGTHDELLARGGLYSELWNHQSQGFLVGAGETNDDPHLLLEEMGELEEEMEGETLVDRYAADRSTPRSSRRDDSLQSDRAA